MENILQLSPMQSLVILLLNAWILIVFPIVVIKKINYLIALLENQVYGEHPEE